MINWGNKSLVGMRGRKMEEMEKRRRIKNENDLFF